MDFSITIGRYMFLILVKNFGPPTSRVLRKSPLKEYEPEWDCISVVNLEDGTELDQPIDIDKYSKQITEKLLDILSELSENSRQEELERVVDMKGY